MRLYISGPMTGYPDFNYPAFEAAAARLREAGFEVVSPHEVNPADGVEHAWEWYLRRDIVALMECDGVVVLPGWEKSKGARVETDLAGVLGMNVVELAFILDERAA